MVTKEELAAEVVRFAAMHFTASLVLRGVFDFPDEAAVPYVKAIAQKWLLEAAAKRDDRSYDLNAAMGRLCDLAAHDFIAAQKLLQKLDTL